MFTFTYSYLADLSYLNIRFLLHVLHHINAYFFIKPFCVILSKFDRNEARNLINMINIPYTEYY